MGLREAADLFKVPVKSIKRWVQRSQNGGMARSSLANHHQHSAIVQLTKKGRKSVKELEFERNLADWFADLRKKGVAVTVSMTRAKAQELRQSRDFIPSKAWLEKFAQRYGLTFAMEPPPQLASH